MGFEPLITSLAAGMFLREHIGPRRWAGFALGLGGVALLHGVWRADFQWTGLGASLIFISSFVCEAAYSVIKTLAISLLVGTAANLLIDGGQTVAAAHALSVHAWLLLLALAVICTSVGYSIWFLVIRECPVNVAALTVFAQAVFGVGLASIWLHEELHLGQLFGCLAITAALVLGLSRQIEPA